MAQITIDDDCKMEMIAEANTLAITYGQALERRWYGYPEKEKIAEDERKALARQIKNESSRYKIIEAAVKDMTNKAFGRALIINCADILGKAIEKKKDVNF